MNYENFATIFKRPAETLSSAHGRVNLIGEHTDYNGGFVLPLAIPQGTRVQLSKRTDHKVGVASANIASDKFEYSLGHELKRDDWTDYVQGVTAVIAKAELKIGGFDMFIDSTIPMGSGLSSSAALEVAVIRAINTAFGLGLNPLEIAKLGQKVENEFVGARVGIMDQMAVSLCEEGSALFIDTQSFKYEQVTLPPTFSLTVINSGITHSHAGGEYNRRRQECEEACAQLKINQLRDLTSADLPRLNGLPKALAARARHVITENERVVNALDALKNGDMNALGQLFVQSHISMRDDYEVSCREIDLLVELALAEPGVHGARLTGGGFGGSIIILSQKEKQSRIAKNVAEKYQEKTGHHGAVLVPRQESEMRQ